ncbi:conserved exported hypothetical protein [Desulfosarcina cetonica]|uniref:hypothetical protein n=1 Tax=Desulfosarcina cetonica TaxID=90730 RepID=UPI0006D0585B|nr:hypothetical protein [Desulfosarcina cetonica]VTR65089.1 conserved exported hypothetical protein [Desulfosarcina cetonica]
MRFRFFHSLLFGTFLLLQGIPNPVLAQDNYQISVDTILAARGDTVIDSQLKRHINDLRAMFNYTSYRLIGSETLNLRVGQSGMVSLPGDRRLRITPQKIVGKRADLSLQMMKNGQTVFQSKIQILNRGSLFVGGPTYMNGNLIFRISSTY